VDGNSRSGTIGFVINEYINKILEPNEIDYKHYNDSYMNYVQLTPVIKILLEKEFKNFINNNKMKQ
jgi:hypothetical protein